MAPTRGGRVQRGLDFRIAFRRTEAHDDIFGLHDRFEPGPKRMDKSSAGSARFPTITG